MFEPLKQKYQALTPKQKKMFFFVGIPSALFFIYFMYSTEEIAPPPPDRNVSEKGFFDTDTEEFTLAALSTKVSSFESQIDTTNQRLSAVTASQKRIEDLVEDLSGDEQSVRSFYEINRQLEEMQDVLKRFNGGGMRVPALETTDGPQFVQSDESGESAESDSTSNESDSKTPLRPEKIVEPEDFPIDYTVKKTNIPDDPLEFVTQAANRNSIEQGSDQNLFVSSGNEQTPISIVNTTVIGLDEEAHKKAQAGNGPELFRGKRVLAGSVIPFVLINGFDAPTGKANSSEPVSATVRISGPALLPNGYSVDLTGCVVTNLVRGNEATERASLRPDRLTCKYSYGEVDVAIQGYASGKDGAAGLRGVLRSKAKKALLYGGIAGFVGGLSNAFGGGGSSNYSVLGSDPFALPSSDQALRSSAISGLSSTSDFLTDYYTKKLDALYDFIEIKPLVTGTIHVMTTFETSLLGQTGTSERVDY